MGEMEKILLRKMHVKNLTKGNPLKVILAFAIPLYMGQLFQLFYGLVDTRIIGQTLGEASLAAVGTTTSLSDLLIEFLNGIICGFGILMAHFYGAKDEKKLKKAIGGTVILSLGITIAISGIGLVFLPQILDFMNVSEELSGEAYTYIRIIIIGLVATTFYNICAVILRAIGDSFTPLIFLIISNILNIVLDYFFILQLHTGVAGAAVATIISQGLSAILCFGYMQKKYKLISFQKSYFAFDKAIYKELLPTGLSMGFMISFVTIGSLALQTSINTLGTNIIVAHTAARKITMIFLIPFFVLGTALATYCGQNLGAKEYGRIKKGIRDTILAALGWCGMAIAVLFLFSPQLVTMITASEGAQVIEMATLYLKVNVIFYFLPAIICILRNSMQGFGDTKTPLLSSVIELVGKVLIAYLLVPIMGYYGVIVSEPIVWALMVLPLVISMKKNPFQKMEPVGGQAVELE